MKLKSVKQGLKLMNINHGNLHDCVLLAKQQLNLWQSNMSSSPSSEELTEEKRRCDILTKALWNEEKLLKQKSRIHWLKHGDGNNKFFFNSCKGRWNRNKILNLEDDNGVIHSTHREISEVAVNYFQSLLGDTVNVQQFPENISIPTTEAVEMDMLVKPFEAADILRTLKSMAKGKCPGPDGFTPEFFIASWNIVGADVQAAVLYFFDSSHMPRIINSAAIALVPKVCNPSHMGQFRPISCCNTLYKCIAKMLADRIKRVLGNLISPCQTAFVPGRRIGDNILLAQSLCRDYHLNFGGPRTAIKMDIRKAFDTLSWDFLFTTLVKMQFPQKFIDWIKVCVSTSMLSVKINGALEGFFKAKSGLRQGDPLSPYLFVIAMEVLTACLKSATSVGDFSYHWRAKAAGVSHLIFADDLFLFCKGDIPSVKALMRGVEIFSLASGLHFNPDKCLYFFGNVPHDVQQYTLRSTGFSCGSLPIKYLGLPLVSGKVSSRDCTDLISRLSRNIETWTSKFLNQAGRIQLISSFVQHARVLGCIFISAEESVEKDSEYFDSFSLVCVLFWTVSL